MKKCFLMSVTIAMAAFAFAEAPKSVAPTVKMDRHAARAQYDKLTPQERQEKMLKATGGFIMAPNSLKGKVAIINTQDVVPEKDIQSVASRITSDAKMNFIYQKSAPADPAQLLKNSGAVAAVIVVNDEKQPIALIALEDGWAIVNVAKIGRGLKTDEARAKFVPSRTAKEISRCTAILCGGSRSQFKGNVMDVNKLEDLDLIIDGLPMDRIVAMKDFLKAKGMTEEKRVPYRKACMEGWAPAPTNDYQKAVWDKVHSLPTNPIKVKYDPKKGE